VCALDITRYFHDIPEADNCFERGMGQARDFIFDWLFFKILYLAKT